MMYNNNDNKLGIYIAPQQCINLLLVLYIKSTQIRFKKINENSKLQFKYITQ